MKICMSFITDNEGFIRSCGLLSVDDCLLSVVVVLCMFFVCCIRLLRADGASWSRHLHACRLSVVCRRSFMHVF